MKTISVVLAAALLIGNGAAKAVDVETSVAIKISAMAFYAGKHCPPMSLDWDRWAEMLSVYFVKAADIQEGGKYYDEAKADLLKEHAQYQDNPGFYCEWTRQLLMKEQHLLTRK